MWVRHQTAETNAFTSWDRRTKCQPNLKICYRIAGYTVYSNVRHSIWRERVDMHTKLYGPLPELEKTVAFIAQAGIGI